jgi:hypothetical protein
MFPLANSKELEAQVSHLRESARALAAALEPEVVERVPVQDAARVWQQLVAAQRLLAGAVTVLARRVEAREAWQGEGARSAAEFVARTAGVGEGEARRILATSERLAEQPAVAEAMRAGRISPTQAQVVADAVSVNPSAAPELLEAAASHAMPRLREVCSEAKFRGDADPEARYDRIRRARRCRTFADSDGSNHLQAQGAPVDLARFSAELDRLTDAEFRKAHAAGRRESLEAYRFDALMAMADRSARADQAVAGAPTAGGKRRRKAAPPNPAFMAIVRVDHAALVRGQVEGEELCEIAGIGPIPVRVARQVLGEAVVKLIVTKGRDANVTHLGRGANAVQRTALLWRQPRCSIPGCPSTHLEADHILDYTRTRHTTLDELEWKCTFHHDQKTQQNWDFTDDGGPRAWVPPSHPRHPSRCRPAARAERADSFAR